MRPRCFKWLGSDLAYLFNKEERVAKLTYLTDIFTLLNELNKKAFALIWCYGSVTLSMVSMVLISWLPIQEKSGGFDSEYIYTYFFNCDLQFIVWVKNPFSDSIFLRHLLINEHENLIKH